MNDTPETATTADETEDARIAQIRMKVRGLRHHIIVYCAVNALLFLIDVTTAGGPWFIWPLLGWGIGLAMHWISVMRPDSMNRLGKEWEDRAVERLSRRDD